MDKEMHKVVFVPKLIKGIINNSIKNGKIKEEWWNDERCMEGMAFSLIF